MAAAAERRTGYTAAVSATVTEARPDFSQYRDDPGGFAREVLGIKQLWRPIEDALLALLKPPYKVSIDSGHSVGKSFGMAVAVLWWFYTREKCWIITTAPTDRDVKDILWTQIRLLHKNAKVKLPADLMPAAPEMRSSDDHVAKGYTARDANSAVGRHRENMLFLFDEKEGVPALFWDGMKSMLRPGSGDAAIAVGNPHTTTTRAYFEHNRTVPGTGEPAWHRVNLSSLDHPNVAAGLRGEPEPIPGAVTAAQVDEWVGDWCDPVVAGDRRPTDFEWRGRVWRAGPIGEPRILGLRPSAGTDGVWSEAAFQLCLGPLVLPDPDEVPVVGCDCAGYGYDFTAIHARCGGVSLSHDAGSGWGPAKIADRLFETADRLADWYNARKTFAAPVLGGCDIPINIEDDMQGRAVQAILAQRRYTFVPVCASGQPCRPARYKTKRSELWFGTRDRGAAGGVNLTLLPQDVQARIRQQFLAPKWAPDEKGRRVVEAKEDTRKKLGRSPDDADAVNIAYQEPADGEIVVVRPGEGHGRPGTPQTRRDWATDRGLYGVKKTTPR